MLQRTRILHVCLLIMASVHLFPMLTTVQLKNPPGAFHVMAD